jgi:hypothetical protein
MAWLVSVGSTGTLRVPSIVHLPICRGRVPTAAKANATGEFNGESLVVGEAKPNAANTIELTSKRVGVGCSGTAEMAMTVTGLLR